jgi:DNA polymerase-3 subunit epsilon
MRTVASLCRVLDTLALARKIHPGQRNSLDALCKRNEIDNTRREWHGALLDAQILADVYLAMTGGQSSLLLDASGSGDSLRADGSGTVRALVRPPVPLRVLAASDEELRSHAVLLETISKASGGRCLWVSLQEGHCAQSA